MRLELRLAVRNLRRNRWRTALTLGGIAVATALLTWMSGWIAGMEVQMISAATAVELGQIQVASPEYTESPSIYDAMDEDEALLERIEDVAGVQGAAPRLRLFGLIGHERRSQVARLNGVDPAREADVSLLDEAVVEGRWLSATPPDYPAPREVVLGDAFARLLGVGLGDELVLFVNAADGSLGNDLLVVVGLLRTGNSAIDRMGAYIPLADAQYLAALDGRAHEIGLRVDAYERAPAIAAAVAGVLPAEQYRVRAWQEVLPELSTMLELNDRSIWIMVFIIYLIVALGIVNTQRMSALERRREFGVLMATGLTPGRLGRMIMAETLTISLLGGVIGVALGTLITWYHATYGLDMTAMSSTADGFSFMGVSFSERIYFVLDAKGATIPLTAISIVAVVCGLWPAWSSARIDPNRAIAGRT